MNPVRSLGRSVLAMLRTAGAVAMFAGRGVVATLSPPLFLGQFWRQLGQIGYFSLPVVVKPAALSVPPSARLSVTTPGAGGYGNPAERDPARVAEDGASGKFSAEWLRAHYSRTKVNSDGG